MTYCVYFKSSGIIKAITSEQPSDNTLSYFTLTNNDAEKFLGGELSLSSRVVVTDSNTFEAKLVDPRDLEKNWADINDIVFSLPRKNPNQSDLVIVQNRKEKNCVAKLVTKVHRNIDKIVLAACVPGDPHLLLWIWIIDYREILDNDVKINYTGTDDIEFYTRRQFANYSHEQN